MAYPISNRYKEVIYGGDYSHKLRIWFNEVELENADLFCEELVVKRRIVPNGAKNFSLNNFISQSIELTLHDRNSELEGLILSPIRIEIGTLVDNDYEFVPIGIFNIDDEPQTDKDKITITARDNSSKFDFGYNAKPIIDLHEGSATKLQILQDICEKAGVETNVTTFAGADDPIGIYDNTITARQYICNIAEQSGSIATINREGVLIFVNINDLVTWEIPLDIIEKYEFGVHYKIGRIIYESGVIRYESEENTDDVLYLDAVNDYVNENTINLMKSRVLGFEIDSIKTGKILGNPAIDSYDLITFTDEDKVFTTLATYDLKYTGVMIQTFDTPLDKTGVETNVTLNKEATFKKWAKTSIDSVKGEIEFTTGKIEQVEQNENNNYQQLLNKFQEVNNELVKIGELEYSVRQLQTDTYTKTEVNQIASGIGVDGQVVTSVITTSGIFDENGMTYEKTNAKTKTTINEVGVDVKDSSNNSLLFSGYVNENNDDYSEYVGQTIVGTDNVIVKNYLEIGTHSRIQDYEDGTGIFYRGGRI